MHKYGFRDHFPWRLPAQTVALVYFSVLVYSSGARKLKFVKRSYQFHCKRRIPERKVLALFKTFRCIFLHEYSTLLAIQSRNYRQKWTCPCFRHLGYHLAQRMRWNLVIKCDTKNNSNNISDNGLSSFLLGVESDSNFSVEMLLFLSHF